MKKALLRLALVVLAALVLGLLFAAYQQPALLLQIVLRRLHFLRQMAL